MDREASTSHDVLERMLLDESAEPTNLPLSLLEDITNCFSLNNEIGSGGFAVVYKGVVGKGTVAVKKLSKTYGIHENKFQEEVKCLIKAKHKNIVQFLGYCSDQQGKMEECDGILVMADQRNMLLCFEYVCNGSLDKHITAADTSDGLNWRQRYQIIRGICEGLLFLHEKRIIHLDLKPANILLDGHMVPKITDFGLSRILSQLQTRAITENICGTRGYMGPEYITSGQITFASDIYSLGVIIIEIMKGERQHFEDEHVVESWRIQLEASEGDMHLEQVRVCYMIGRECMNDDPKKRPIARHIVDRLDKTATAGYSGETSTCSSLFEPHVSLPREQSGESIGKLAAESLQVDVEERSEILEDATKSCEWEGQQKVDTLALCGVQETNQKVNRRGTSISSSISTVFYKLNNLDIFNRKAKRKAKGEAYMHYHTLEMLNTIKVFRIEKLKPLITGINLIGKGRFCEVYKGIVNNALVALKILITTNNQLENEAFINEVTIMPQISHKNIVRLIGCCLEVDTPILVYELMPNGSMNDILHGGNRSALNLDVRLTIIAESAQGLAYLHSQARIKILHGAVKPEKILLDQNFMPKITGFGLSRLITGDKENATYVIGDMSYMDPVYLQTGLLTLKSDVYSFGVVILEVISRKKATHSDKNSLVRSFLEVHKEGKKATELFDKEIAVTTEDLELLDCLAEIALECLNLDVDQRPTMMDVAERLLILNRSRRSQAV